MVAIGKKPKRPLWKRLVGWLGLVVLVFVVATWLMVLSLRWFDPPVTAFMLFENRVPSEATRYGWRDRNELGDEAALAVMASEDQRFPYHHGLDLGAISDAMAQKRSGNRLRGASSISQQVVKNLFLWSGRSFVRKGLEAYFAVLIEINLPKHRILEIYLNIVELGPGIYGVPAGARIYFDKNPSTLTREDAALLAAVLPNPNRLHAARPSAYVRERQDWIVAQAQRLQSEGWLEKIAW